MANLNHPNWSGKSYRTSQQAFGSTKLVIGQKKESKFWWVLSAVLVILICILAFAPLDAQAKDSRAQYSERHHDRAAERQRERRVERRENRVNKDTSSWFKASPKYRENPRLEPKRKDRR